MINLISSSRKLVFEKRKKNIHISKLIFENNVNLKSGRSNYHWDDNKKFCTNHSINLFLILIKSLGLDKLSKEPILINTSRKLGPFEFKKVFIVEFIPFNCEILK